jgi:hypothetical protein
MVTKAEVGSAIRVIQAVASTIKELGEVPSGVLYAQLCGIMSLEQYTSIIETLKRLKLVSEKGHLLTWIG